MLKQHLKIPYFDSQCRAVIEIDALVFICPQPKDRDGRKSRANLDFFEEEKKKSEYGLRGCIIIIIIIYIFFFSSVIYLQEMPIFLKSHDTHV